MRIPYGFVSMKQGKSLGNKVVLAKIPREEFSRFQQYCEHNGETINFALRKMILSEIDNPSPSKIAGRSTFIYNKNTDDISWRIILDDERELSIDDNLSIISAEHFIQSLSKAIEERNTYIKKNNVDSVSFPNNLLRKRK